MAFKVKRDPLDALFSDYIRARDGHTCRRCGRRHGKLEAHHIISRRYNATRYLGINGVTLCFACHRWVHEKPLAATEWIKSWMAAEDILELDMMTQTPGKKARDYERGIIKAALMQRITELEGDHETRREDG